MGDASIERLTQSYITEGGTTEFCTSRDGLLKMTPELRESSRELIRLKHSRWVAWVCNTCAGYSGGERDVHVEIASMDSWPTGYQPDGGHIEYLMDCAIWTVESREPQAGPTDCGAVISKVHIEEAR